MQATVTIYGDEVLRTGHGDDSEEVEVGALGFDSLSVSMAGEARANGDMDGGALERCKHCGQALSEDADSDGKRVTEDGAFCTVNPDGDDHEAEYVPGSFANSARVIVSDDDEVAVTISVGDPRGAFVMRVHRSSEDGALYLSVPDPSDGMPHMALTQERPGFFRIGN